MPSKPKNSDEAGIKMHGKSYWLAYTFEGQQYKVNLRTSDFAAAVVAARPIRGGLPPGKKESGQWEKEIINYCKAK